MSFPRAHLLLLFLTASVTFGQVPADATREPVIEQLDCPSCGEKMLLRTARQGRSEGDTFFGCRHYPRCKNVLRVPRAA